MLLSAFGAYALERLERLTAARSWFLVLGGLFVLVVLVNGIGLVPFNVYWRLASNPFITRTDIGVDNYWQETVLLPVVTYYAGWTSRLAFNLFCVSTILAAYGLFAAFTSRFHGPLVAFIFTALLVTTPLTTVLLSWLGTPDGLTFLLTIPFLFISSTPVICGLTLVGAMNHSALVIGALEILALRFIAADTIRRVHLIAASLGGSVGYVLMKVFLSQSHIHIVSRLDFIFSRSLGTWTTINIANLPMTLFSLFNIHWSIIIVCVAMFFKFDRRFYFLVLLSLAVNSVMSFFTEDTTRVFSLISWGVLFECMFYSHKLATKAQTAETPYADEFLQALIVIGVVSFVTPRYYSWIGKIMVTPSYTQVRELLG